MLGTRRLPLRIRQSSRARANNHWERANAEEKPGDLVPVPPNARKSSEQSLPSRPGPAPDQQRLRGGGGNRNPAETTSTTATKASHPPTPQKAAPPPPPGRPRRGPSPSATHTPTIKSPCAAAVRRAGTATGGGLCRWLAQGRGGRGPAPPLPLPSLPEPRERRLRSGLRGTSALMPLPATPVHRPHLRRLLLP